MEQSQQQWQGPERRQSLGPYSGADRRKPAEPAVPYDSCAEVQKDEQQRRAQQQSKDHDQA
jgi:hypothetical protein